MLQALVNTVAAFAGMVAVPTAARTTKFLLSLHGEDCCIHAVCFEHPADTDTDTATSAAFEPG